VASVARARAFLGLLGSSCALGEHAEALRAGQSALGMNIREVEPHVRYGLATVYWKSGDLRQAEQETLAASQLYNEQGDRVGQTLVTAHLGEMYLAEGDVRRALTLLTKARESQVHLLDVSRLGETCRLEARAHRRLGRLDDAIRCLSDSLRYHAEAGRHGAYIVALRDLAGCLDLRGEPETSLALHVHALQGAERMNDGAQVFRSVTASLKVIADRRTHLDAVPYLVQEGQRVLHDAVSELTKMEVAEFVGVTAALTRIGAEVPRAEPVMAPVDFPHPEAWEEAQALVSRLTDPSLRDALHARVAGGIRIRRAPCADHMVGFLTGWFGGWFRNADYQAEFLLTQETSKYHLRELRNLEIIRQIGTRKAARYQLGFHLASA
jgi:tetratricopeptide (TPR) repeat protein